ncbi:MAG: RcnB family protein [Steroidobacteraceae bacterium]
MKKRMIMGAMVLSLAVGSLALADPPQQQGYDQQHHQERHHVVQHGHAMHRASARFNTGRYVHPHGYYAHTWRRGERLPAAYRTSAYVIPNYAVYRLRRPPAGYYWVRVDNNAVLAAVATGAVVSVSLNLFH